MSKPKTVDEYILSVPEHAREKLKELRSILKKAAPNATEDIKWGLPVFIEKRILFSYGTYKDHLNFMPTRYVLDKFESEVSDYTTGRDTIQFPYDKPLPEELIQKLATSRRKDVVEDGSLWMGGAK